MADFKKITEVPVIEEPNEGDTLMIVSDGELKQISASSFAAASGGSGGGLVPVYVYDSSTDSMNQGKRLIIHDVNEVGISTGTELYNYMLAGGQIIHIGYSIQIPDGNYGDYEPSNSIAAQVISMVPDSASSPTKYYCVINISSGSGSVTYSNYVVA
jgi:hypothetical protein